MKAKLFADNNSKVTRGRKYQFLPLSLAFNYMRELKRNRRYAKAAGYPCRTLHEGKSLNRVKPI